MTFYPKQPFGPSAPGTAGVRALDIADSGGFQRRWIDSNTQSLKQGMFRKVLTGGAEYVSAGRVSPTSVQTRQVVRYQFPFTPYIPLPPKVNMENGKYATIEGDGNGTPLFLYEYTIYPGKDAPFGAPVSRAQISVVYGTFYGGQDYRGTFDREYRFVSAGGGAGAGIDPAGPDLYYVADESGVKVTSYAMLVDDGRTDLKGRTLHDILWAQFRTGEPSQSIVLNTPGFTRDDAEFSAFHISVATGDYSVLMAAERFFAPGQFEVAKDYEPKFWMFIATDNSLASITAYNVTDYIFPDGFYPDPTPAGTDTEGDPYPAHYATNAGGFRDRKLDFTMALCQVVVLANNNIVLMFPQLCMSSTPGAPPRWHFRIVTLNVSSLAAATPVDEDIGPGLEVQAYVQSAVHLGEGWILAKRVNGFAGANFDVVFMLSTNGGADWVPFTPTGFTAEMKNRFYGNFIVHKARKDSQPGVVLVPAWDEATSSVHVWASLDNGITWAKRGLMSKPTTFYRIDQMLIEDGGDNFGTLTPGPDPSRPADMTLPDRYKTEN